MVRALILRLKIRSLWLLYILATDDVKASGGHANNDVPFKNCAPFTKYIIHINDEQIDTAGEIDIMMPM